jgi:gluconate 2-dehydrogenase gamma chain
MRRFWEISRRRFLGLLGMLGALRAVPRTEGATPRALPPPALGFKVLTSHQATTLGAIADQLIPPDQDPGAREAGAVIYIDRVLAGEQKAKRPLYAAGIAGIDETSRKMFGKGFIKLQFDQQTQVLRAVEQGKAEGETWRKSSSSEFFFMVWQHVLEGFYGPPEHGGNKDYVSWTMVGFPHH